MEEFVPCGKCNDGYIYHETEEGAWASRCQCLIDWKERRKQEIAFDRAGLHESDLNYDPSQYLGKDKNKNVPKIRQYVDQFGSRYRNVCLYFWSPHNSTQKTTLAKWIVAEVVRQKFSAKFILFNDLVLLLQQYNFDQSLSAEYDRALNSDLLVVDDAFDTNKSTVYRSGYQFAFIDTFFRNRLEIKRRATIFTSNVPIEEIGENYTVSIEALINRNAAPLYFEDRIEAGKSVGGIRGKDLFPEITGGTDE